MASTFVMAIITPPAKRPVNTARTGIRRLFTHAAVERFSLFFSGVLGFFVRHTAS